MQSRRAGDPASAGDLGALDADAIARVIEEERPDPRDAGDLHDAMLTAGFLTWSDLQDVRPEFFTQLVDAHRAGTFDCGGAASGVPRWVAAVERLPELRAIHPDLVAPASLQPPPSRLVRTWTRPEAIVEILRGRLTLTGPVTAGALAATLGIASADADLALLQLEAEGVVLRGRFTPGANELEWCERSLLARIHRYTLNRLRAEIEPVSPADFMRFLFRWQHVASADRLTGPEGLREIIAKLDGYELAAGAWERAVLPARLDRYDPSMLDMICLTGEAGWARLSPAQPGPEPGLVSATPIALFLLEHVGAWRSLRMNGGDPPLCGEAQQVLAVLRARGASFLRELAPACGLDADQLRQAIGTLVACGLATSDGFSGLRALVWASRGRPAHHDRRSTFAGRWTAIAAGGEAVSRDEAVEQQAWALLRRYGVVFRRLLTRETNAATWRELARVYRRLEARGEIRSGRFVTGMSGEQFALPGGVERLREVRRTPDQGRLVTISAADPLNLTGVVTSGERIRVTSRNRIVYGDGIPLAVVEAGVVRALAPIDPAIAAEVWGALQNARPQMTQTKTQIARPQMTQT